MAPYSILPSLLCEHLLCTCQLWYTRVSTRRRGKKHRWTRMDMMILASSVHPSISIVTMV